METETLQAITSHNFSLYELFLRADIIVKSVMGLLVLLSVWSWAIIIDKFFSVGGAVSRAKQFEEAFWSGQPIEDLDDHIMTDSKEAMARVFTSAKREWQDARRISQFSDSQSEALINRAERLMTAATDREMSRLEKGLGVLATIGSVSPFVGLFGTVWGIMNSFREIAGTGSTNLAVVAPGIAEALFATALGLVAAVPAVTFYNKFSSQLAGFGDRLDTFTQEFVVRLSRRLYERRGEG
ncbi:protein TolQ [Ponticaulis sp.]|uniref:protein TolQ n=1 Tax=Ponticaulis sp. TaxID=2020902 RepID=UPI000B636206|nr:protein TolQ [Ponticaulis sp.]MAI90592.1 protein TolQ [Ponticaulis sp.]OUX99106.1 MAG: protein TolQ [Hyphomonadaceae bacterium TMED5]|tara:strand:+ start:110114 stop:110833 length:720 start_codon:yes stop_codon:yes gene_type:complete